jgi:hypothetical protein
MDRRGLAVLFGAVLLVLPVLRASALDTFQRIESPAATVRAAGTIKKTGITSYMHGTHALIDNEGRALYALKSDRVGLDSYAGRRVTVFGEFVKGYPVDKGPCRLNVTSVSKEDGPPGFFVFTGYTVLASGGAGGMPARDDFKIYLIEGRRYIDEVGYDRKNSKWADFFASARLDKILVDGGDIREYDWENQTMILRKEAAERIRHDYGKDRFSLDEKMFIVTLKGQRLYAGAILSTTSPRAIRYPVMHVSIGKEVTLAVKPGLLKSFIDDEARRYMRPHEVKSFFMKLSSLKEQR